jgi:hypothetical protein
MQTRTSARLPSRRLCRRGLCQGFLPGAADLAGRRVPAVLPATQEVQAGAQDVRPRRQDGAAAPASPVAAEPDVRPAVLDAAHLEAVALAQDARQRRRASAERPEAGVPIARVAVLGAVRLAFPEAAP